MPKHTASVSALFDRMTVPRKKSEKAARDVLAPKPTGISKHPGRQPSIFAQYAKPKKKRPHPVYTSFVERVNEYRQGVAATRGQQLEPVYNALIARVDGLDINGKPLKNANLPSQAEIDALADEEAALSKSLDDERMTIQNHRRNGTVKTKEVRLGDTMHAFQRLADQKQMELKSLFQELEHVDAEISATKDDIFETEQSEIQKLNKQLNIDLESLKHQASTLKAQTVAEVEQARKDDRAAKREVQRKFEELMESFE